MTASLAIARNGTQQFERVAAELSAEFVSIEERSVEQQLTFMQKVAEHIRFFTLENTTEGDWRGLFENDLSDMLNYMNDPTAFAPESNSSAAEQRNQLSRLAQLSEPQRVLVYIFARMTQTIRRQFNQLTQAHLDFYYTQVLQIEPGKGRPDKVHLLCSVADGVSSTTLATGTLFDGGTDTAGNPVHYALDDTFQINTAQIGEVKSLRVARDYVSLNQMRQLHSNGFEVILRWALGQYFRGDLLPNYPLGRYFDARVDMKCLLDLHTSFSGDNAPDQNSDVFLTFNNYSEVVLGFASVSDFHAAMAVYAQSIDDAQEYPAEAQWIRAADKIETAFSRRWQQKQRQQLVDVYRPSANGELGRLLALFERVFGDPLPGDRLPAMPTTSDTLESLYLQLTDEALKGSDNTKLIARYIASLDMSVDDFLFFYRLHLRSSDLYKLSMADILDPNQPAETSWYRFFFKLQRLDATLRDKTPPQPGRDDIRSMLPDDAVTLGGGTPAFGVADNRQAPENYYGPGLAVVSPLLHLAEAERHIHLELACQQQDFPLDDLLLAKQRGKLHFNLHLSNDSGGQTLNTHSDGEAVTFEIAHIGSDLIVAFAPAQLDLVVKLASDTVAVNFDDYLILKDGAIWQVVGYGTTTSALRLRYLSQVKGLSDARNLRLPQLDLVQEATPLNSLSYAPSKLEVSLTQADDGYGSTPEAIAQGDFVVLNSGQVLLLTQLTEDGQNASVEELGYLPGVLMDSLNGNNSAKVTID